MGVHNSRWWVGLAAAVYLVLLLPLTGYGLPGDLDGSGRVDGYDLIIMGQAFGTGPSDNGWHPDADLNQDGIVDQGDLEILSAHFGRNGVTFGLWTGSEYGNERLFKLSATGNVLQALTGFTTPVAIAGNIDDNTVWVGDAYTDKVMQLSGFDGERRISVSGMDPAGVSVDPRDGSVWVADYGNHRLVKLLPGIADGYDVNTDTGSHLAVTGFRYPRSVSVNPVSGVIWAADAGNNQVVRLLPTVPHGYDIGTGLGSHTARSGFSNPYSVSVNSTDGTAWVADYNHNQVVKLSATGTTETIRVDGFRQPIHLDTSFVDGSVWIADYGNHQVVRLAADGSLICRVSGFSSPYGVAVNPLNGSAWVADYNNGQVVHLAPNGTELMRVSGISRPRAVAVIADQETAGRYPVAAGVLDKNNVAPGETIVFSGTGNDPDGTLRRYEWDFDGDGTIDFQSGTTGVTTHAYTREGLYNPVFRVTDNDWLTATDYSQIVRVGELSATARADVLSGSAPLEVNFSGSFVDPIDGFVDSYQWDFDGDNIFDHFSDTTPDVRKIFDRAGQYAVVFKITDGPHAAVDQLMIEVSAAPPEVTATAAPVLGKLPLTVAFSGTATDPDGDILLYEWDFDGDGVFDRASVAGPDVSHTYHQAGSYAAVLRVTDNDGTVASASVTVDAGTELVPFTAAAHADQTAGRAPLTVNFDADQSTGDDILSYEWHFGECRLFSDSMDTADHWQADTPWQLTGDDFTSRPFAWTNSTGGSYPNNADHSLTSRSLDLSGVTTATLNFQHRYQTESYRDYCRVEISLDGGSTWTQLRNNSGTQAAWTPVSINLSWYLPSPDVRIRFRFTANDSVNQGGWFIDDVRICSDEADWVASDDGTAVHTYDQSGTWTAQVRLTDGGGIQKTDAVDIHVNPAYFPEAGADADPITGESPLAVNFTAQASDTDGTVVSYAWNFGEEYVWVADEAADQAVRLCQDGTCEMARTAGFDNPYAVSVNPADGTVWVADYYHNEVVRLSASGQTELVRTGGFNRPAGVSVNPGDGSVWVADYYNNQVVNLSAEGVEQARIGGFYRPVGVSVNPSDNSVWVADYGNDQVVKLSGTGVGLKRISGFNDPYDLSVNPADGTVWVANTSGDSVVRLDADVRDGYHLGEDTGSHMNVTGFNDPYGVAVNPADSSVWVTDFYNNQVVRLGTDGSELSRTDGFNRPIDVAVNPADGTAWVADYYNNQVVKLAPSGRVLTRRGGFNRPRSVAVAGTGAANLFSSSASGNTTHTYTMPGRYHAVFTATDNDGYKDEQSVDISVFGSPQVTASASTVSGTAPLEVFFTAGIVELSGTVVRYEWDFDGDGAYDSLSGITPNVRHVYPVAGTYDATFRATTDLGYEGTDSVTVTVSAVGPDARAAAAPVAGNLPLTVNFTGAGTDPDGSIAVYEWDFDGDGTMDFTSSASGITQHTYSVAGSYTALFRVTDNQGLTAVDILTIRVAEASAPSAVIQPVSGLSGYAPFNAWFHVQGIDPDGTIAKVEIDFDGDGTFEAVQPTAFGDDLETGAGSWTADGSWARTLDDAWSPSFSWTDSPGGNYGDNADTSLTSPTIDLSGTTAPALVFQHKYDLKSGDYARIEISGNDGGTWSQLKAVSNAVQAEWVKESFDLSAYAGNPSVKVRFRLTSNAEDTADGWYVDDVWVGEPVGHTFTAPGTHDVVLRVTDNNGNISETTRTVLVTAGENAAFVWVADYSNNRVVKLSDRGDVRVRVYGFNRPRVVEVNPETGDVWVSDTNNHRIVKLNKNVTDGYDASRTVFAPDSSPKGSPGAIYGDTVLSGTGRLNSGYYFDGSGDYVQIPDHPDFRMDSWTLEAWIRPDILSGNRTVAGRVSQGKDVALMMTGNRISVLIYDGGRKFVTSPDALTAGQWYHTAAVYDAETGLVRLYVDGVLKAEQALTPDTSNTDPLMIGRSNCCSEYFYGTIDEVRVWNIARSQVQISGSRNSELSGNESGLVGYWPLNSIDTPYHLTVPGFNTPYGLGVDTSDNSVWVADRNNHRMVHLNDDGTLIRRIYGFSYPQDVVVNPDDGAVWVSDTSNDRVVKLLPQVTDGYAASTAGITPDSGPHGNFGMLIGDTKIDEGHLNSGMGFDGGGDYIVIGPDPSLDVQNFTVEAWINGSYVTDRTLFMRGDDAGRNELYIGFGSSTTVQAILDNGATANFSGEVNFTDGQWHHVAVVYDGSFLTCYADGAVYGTPVSVAATLDFGGSQALIGADFDNFNSSLGNYFSGRIDEVRFWGIARTAAQIAAAMDAELTGTESGLAGYWRFNTRIDPYSRMIGGFDDPTGLAVDPGDNGVWVTDYYRNQVVKLASDGSELYRQSGYNRPYSVAVNTGDRTAWVGDYENDRVVKLRSDGNETAWITGFDNPHDVAVNPDDGTVWVADHYHHQVAGLAPDGTEQVRVDGFNYPTSVSIDPAKRRLDQPPAGTAGAVPSGDGNVPLQVSFTGSGTDNGTIVEYAWDFDGDGFYDYVSGTTGDTDHTYAAPGTYTPVLRITDDAGYITYITPGPVVAGPLTVRPAASPASGSAPLNTTLTGYVAGLAPGRSITEYAWDFEGDGVFDYTHPSISRTTHTYGEGGTYTAVIRVTDNLGHQALGSVPVQVTKQPPSVYNHADPVTGATPLAVYLNMNASDSDGSVVRYEWDYDGDGIYDWFSTTDGRTWFTYKTAGTYQPTVRVTDSDGLTATATRTVTVSEQQHPPAAAATASVFRGAVPLTVTFTGTGIDSDGEILLYEWDFDGDGTVDVTSTDTGDTSFTYTASGVFTPRLRVTDDDGLTGDTTLMITVTDSGVPVPVATAVPRTGATPLTVTFSGDGSMDPDGTIVRYDWLFGSETVWVADHYNDRIKQVNGMQVEAIPVGFNDPYRLSVNPDGTVWISDHYNNQIVRVSADGVRELVRAGGFNRPYGVSADPADGGVWVADYNNNQVVRLESDGTESVRAGGFRNPTAVSVYHHDRSVWVADYNNSQVARLAPDGSEMCRITGFNRPFWVEVDQADGSVWVADRYNHRVVKLAADTPTGYDTGISLMTPEATSQGHAMLFGDAAAGAGQMSGAVSLDGNWDYVLIPSDTFGDLTSITVEAWINATYVNGRTVFMRGDATGGNEIYFGFYNGSTIEVVLDNGASQRFSGGINFADGTWHHVAVTYDEITQTLSCYADGAPYGTPVVVAVPDGFTFEGSHALIGSDFDNFNGSLGNFFAGRIDDVRVWNVARTPAQISGSKDAALTGSEPGLIGYWPLDDVYPAFHHRILTGFNGPLHVAVNPGDHTAWVCDYDNSQMVRVSSDNTREILRVGGFNRPHEAVVHPVNNTVWVADRNNNQVVLMSDTGQEIRRISGFYQPTSVALAPFGFNDRVSLTSNQPVTHTYPNIGAYTASLTVTDNEGKRGTDTVTIQAGTYPEARAIAYPTSGTVPLTVRFAASGYGPDGTIEYFRWDFDGNGTTDWETRISENRDYTYTRAGIYTATLSITDNRGLTDVREVVITVHPSEAVPEVVILPDPAGGRVPLDVQFTGLARDHDSTIVRFEWDFDGDGVFDFTSDSSARASHQYTQTGTYVVTLRVTDSDGVQGTGTAPVSVRAGGAPVAAAEASVTHGAAALDVHFTGSGGELDTIVTYEWDFDGDGTFDVSSDSSGETDYTYTIPGSYRAALRITNEKGLSDTAFVNILVTAGISASLSRESFDPAVGETIDINSVLTAPATVTVRITDRTGSVIRTLVQGAARTPGYYSDTWDGRDDQGRIMDSGAYLYVIHYETGGKRYVYDLTNEISGAIDKITPEYPSAFNPFNADTNFFRYTLDRKSEITVYISPFIGGALTRIKTLLLRQAQKAGSYVLVWDGTDDTGNVVDAMSYVLAVFKWPLPENAIIVNTRPIISDPVIKPAYLNPDARPYDDQNQAVMTYTLSKTADVTFSIYDSRNYIVRTLTVAGVPAGAGNTIVWDGKNSVGTYVTPGIYRTKLVATDGKGNRSMDANALLIVFY